MFFFLLCFNPLTKSGVLLLPTQITTVGSSFHDRWTDAGSPL